MKTPGTRKPEHDLADLIRQLASVCLSYRYPLLISTFTLVGAQIGINLSLTEDSLWIPGVAVAAALFWGVVGFAALRLTWRTRVTLTRVVEAFGGLGAMRALWPLGLLTLLTFVIAGIPGLIGVVAVGLFTVFVVSYVSSDLPVDTWVIRTFGANAFVFAVCGTLDLVDFSLPGSISGFTLPGGISGFTLPNGITLARQAAAVIAILAISGVLVAEKRANVHQRNSPVAAWWLILFVAVPSGIIAGFMPTRTWLLAIYGLVFLPLAFLIRTIVRSLDLRAAARRALQEQHLAGALQNMRKQGRKEEVARESDGYYRISSPVYFGLSPRMCDDRGICAWLGGPGATEFPVEQPCIVFRQSCWIERTNETVKDAHGVIFKKLMADLVPNLGASIIELDAVRADLLAPWAVRMLNPSEQVMIAKAPWETAELIVVPRNWKADWTIPPGAGLHDKNGTSCFIEKVSVEINLTQQVEDAVRQGESAPMDDRSCLTQLLWNYNRILPAAYEAVLEAFVASVRDHELLLIATPEKLHTNSQNEAIRRSVNAMVGRLLPAPIQDLVDVRVTGSSVVDTVVFTVDQRNVARQLEGDRLSLPTRADDELRRIIAHLENAFGDSLENAFGDRQGNLLETYLLTRRIDTFCHHFSQAVTDLSLEISKAVGDPKVQAQDQVPKLTAELRVKVDDLHHKIESRRKEMGDFVQKVQSAFGRRLEKDVDGTHVSRAES